MLDTKWPGHAKVAVLVEEVTTPVAGVIMSINIVIPEDVT